MVRSGFPRGTVPNDMAVKDTGSPVLILVCSVKVGKKCLFVDVKGYSTGGATWTIDCFPIAGNTAQFNGPWDELDNFLNNKTYVGTDGKKYNIAITLVDSGWNTEWVYAYVMRHYQGVYVCKGHDSIDGGETYKLFNQEVLKKIGLGMAFHINTGKLKDHVSSTETMLKPKHGSASHYFDTYLYNLAGLEIWATDWCLRVLELQSLDWQAFWKSAEEGYFYDEPEDEKPIEKTIIEKLKEALKQQEAEINIESVQEPFNRGVYHGYREGLNRAISIIFEMKER